jgi:hypothetical protein
MAASGWLSGSARVVEDSLEARCHDPGGEGSEKTFRLPVRQDLLDRGYLVRAHAEGRVRAPGLVPEAVVDPDERDDFPGVSPEVLDPLC